MHYSKFALAKHPWDEPLKTEKELAEKYGFNTRTPKIGEVVYLQIIFSCYSLRIWMKPDRMALHGLVPAEQNIEIPTGILGADSENTFQFALKYGADIRLRMSSGKW